jgi:hypothetical protein
MGFFFMWTIAMYMFTLPTRLQLQMLEHFVRNRYSKIVASALLSRKAEQKQKQNKNICFEEKHLF